MIVAVYLSIYIGGLLFAGGSAWRAYRYAHLPVHLRWELYPIPHEEPRRARYGGSYFEDQHWAGKPQRRHLLGEWLAMAEEILLLKSLRESNRPLWLPSFLFHFGIYLQFAAVALSAAAAMAQSGVSTGIAGAAAAAGLTGGILILGGAALLLARRFSDPALANSTRPGDIFNLLFFLATFLLLISGYLLRPYGTASLDELSQGALHFDRSIKLGGIFATGLIFASALISYIPFTHMAHFVAKYFTWHTVRWDDRPCEPGSAIEKQMVASLGTKPTWSAPHIGADGQQTWAEIATAPPAEVRR